MRIKKYIILTLLLILTNLNLVQTANSEESSKVKTDSKIKAVQNTQENNTKIQPNQQKTSIPGEVTLCLPKDQVPITLEDSVKTALENNYGIKVITTQKDRDKWLYYNSLTTFLPDITFDYIQTRFSGNFLIGGVVPPPGIIPSVTTTSVQTGFTGQWVGFSGFARYFNAKAAGSNYKATKRNLDLTVDQVLLLTTRYYYQLLQSKLNTEILTKALEQTQAQLKINQQRLEAGVGTRFDVLRSEAEVAAASQNLISANNSLKLAQAQLANLIGIDVFTPLMPADSEVTAKILFKDCFDLSKITTTALRNKPEIDIAKLNIAAARAIRNSGYSIYFPTVAVSTSINGVGSHISDLDSNKSISLIVNWQGGQSLGLGGVTNIKVLDEQVKAAKLRLTDTERNIEQSLINSYYNIISAKELIDAASAQVTSAQESLRLAVIRLEAGVGIYTDVINAQLTETQARINYLNALISYNVAQAQLLYDMGVISPGNLLEGYAGQNKTPKGIK